MSKPTGEEVAKLFMLYLSSAAARQLMGDLHRSRAGLDNPGFKAVMDKACAWADAHVQFTYKREEKRHDD